MKLDLNDIAVFNEVVNAGGFTAAGRKLGLPASALSRRVTRLEEHLGFKPLHRSTRAVGLTDSGRMYFEHTADMQQRLEQAAKAVNDQQDTTRGLVRVTAPPDDGGLMWQLLRGFVAEHPDVDVEIIHTLSYVDLVKEGIDVAIRGGSPPDSNEFTAKRIFSSRILLAASPKYLKKHGTPKKVKDLEDHDCIAMDPWAPNAIRSLDGDRGPVRVTVRNRVRSNHLSTAHQAALDGLGIAPVLKLTCEKDLAAKRLVEVLKGALPNKADMFLVYPARRKVSAAAKALISHILSVAPSVEKKAKKRK